MAVAAAAAMARSAGRKLFTPEDAIRYLPFPPHKVLALVALLSIVHRFLFGFGSGVDDPIILAVSLAAHLLLAVSAFVFRQVPTKIKVPHVIDALYRAQVLVFTVRSVMVILVVLTLRPGPMRLFARYAAVVSCHYSADLAQARFGDAATGSGGVRRALRKDEAGQLLFSVSAGRLFFSVAQLNATCQLVYVESSPYVILGAFWTMTVIQLTAFLMTLRKKGLLREDLWKILYSLMLAGVGFRMMNAVDGAELARIIAVSALFALARLRLSVPKYMAISGVAFIAAAEHYVGWR